LPMGAMHNDLERCTFLYADDRRCRNLIQNPGNPFCFYHCEAARKKKEREAVKPAPADGRAARAFLDWLSTHPLDNATHLNRALNQLFFLVLRDRISARQADSLIRTVRLLLKTVPDVRDEFQFPGLRAHAPHGYSFLAQIQELLVFAASQDSESTPQNQQPPPQDQSGAATFNSPGFAEPEQSQASEVVEGDDVEDQSAIELGSFVSPTSSAAASERPG
ncbi:MAG: hypothetical protein ACRD6I_17835, partial [Candidatus Acidiferrales bacterium]